MKRNQNTALVIGGVLLTILIFFMLGFLLVWGFRGNWYGMMGPGMMGGYGAMFLIPIFFIVILGLVIWAVLVATQKSSSVNGTTDYKTETPLEILKSRYARGEIDKEEYEMKKRDIT